MRKFRSIIVIYNHVYIIVSYLIDRRLCMKLFAKPLLLKKKIHVFYAGDEIKLILSICAGILVSFSYCMLERKKSNDDISTVQSGC